MSGNRTRGLLRAAALLAVGTTPLLASAASAAEAPTDIVDGKIGNAPEVVDAAKPATDLLNGQAVKLPAPLPAPLPGSAPEVRAPQVAAPAGIKAPATPELPAVGDALAPQARALPAAPAVPGLQPPVAGAEQLPALPELGQLPVQAPTLG
ncbi:hypothetical protein [Saccharothrix deserti]|uniref:hypothetical protein n=1 Tax=Saccharothrix deserti TaxID=2593674 RepID=UPI00131CD60A|nr:hypothetical protein [Saccharothrix deserti]